MAKKKSGKKRTEMTPEELRHVRQLERERGNKREDYS